MESFTEQILTALRCLIFLGAAVLAILFVCDLLLFDIGSEVLYALGMILLAMVAALGAIGGSEILKLKR